MIETDILQYIPQRPPFVMIDTIIKADATISQTAFTIKPDHLFVKNGYFTEPGIVENMAQTAAAGMGYRSAAEGTQAAIGYIGALKGLIINALPKVNDTLITKITFQHQVMNALIVQGTVQVNEQEIASCELKIFIQQEVN